MCSIPGKKYTYIINLLKWSKKEEKVLNGTKAIYFLAGYPNKHCQSPFPGVPPLQLEKFTYLISQLLTQAGWPCDTVLANGYKSQSSGKAFTFPKRQMCQAPPLVPFPSLNTMQCLEM